MNGFISRSHRAITPFELARPTTLAELIDLTAAGFTPHAGGVDVVRALREGASHERVMHLDGVAELKRIEVDGDRLRIGALVTHHQLATDEVVRSVRPDLAVAWQELGNVRIRRVGTVGGNLLAGDRTYDAAPLLGAAGATLHFASPHGPLVLGVAHPVAAGVLTHVDVPAGGRVVFDRSLKPAVSVALGEERLAVGCAYDTTMVIPRDRLDVLPEPRDDGFASANYRRRMIGVLVERLGARLDGGEERR